MCCIFNFPLTARMVSTKHLCVTETNNGRQTLNTLSNVEVRALSGTQLDRACDRSI